MELNKRNEHALSIFQPFPGVLHFIYPNQTMLCKGFMRLQEFYESPLENDNGFFRGRFFSRDEFKEAYIKSTNTGIDFGEFSYYDDWNGFNIPGSVVDEFIKMFDPDLMEEYLIQAIKQFRGTQPYYVIGTHYQGDVTTIEHELSHAFWHLDQDYRLGAFDIVCSLPTKFRTVGNKALSDMGYREGVFDDEITAYLSTSTMTNIVDIFDTEDIPWKHTLGFQQHFAAHLDTKQDVGGI